MIKKILPLLFFILNYLIPKNKKLICLSSFPDYDDQIRALLNAITKHTSNYKIAILIETKTPPPQWAQNYKTSHYKKHSLKGIWTYLRSKTIFFTHGCFSMVKTVPSQTVINVWHGMPIKKIGQYTDSTRIIYSDYITVTSDFFVDKVSYAFRMDQEQMLNLGLPRNDILLNNTSKKLRYKIGADKKIVVWLPTYRQSIIGEIRLDGAKENNVFNMPDLDIDALNKQLSSLNIIAIVKPHPMAIQHNKDKKIEEYSSIKIIDEKWLLNNNTSLYEILAQSDLLISDISSVLIDYLLLDKPIISHFPDANKYKGSRGLIWDYNPNEYGIPVVSTQKDLLKELKQQIHANQLDKKKLLKFKNLSHDNKKDFSYGLLKHLNLISRS